MTDNTRLAAAEATAAAPTTPHRPGGLSRLTWVGIWAAAIAIVILITLTNQASGSSATSLPRRALAIMKWVSIVLVGFAFLSGVADKMKTGRETKAKAHAGQQATAEAALADARTALAAVYAQHHAALVAEAQRLLAPDKYGRRNDQAAADEFGLFQDEVAAPALRRQGHAADVIDKAFDTDRADLVRGVLRDV